MNEERVKKWSDELRRRSAEESSELVYHRVLWISIHLKEYTERWIGFASMKQLRVSDTFNNDAFCILLGASKIINDLLAEALNECSSCATQWDEFTNSLDYIQIYPDQKNLHMVQDSLKKFLDCLKIFDPSVE